MAKVGLSNKMHTEGPVLISDEIAKSLFAGGYGGMRRLGEAEESIEAIIILPISDGDRVKIKLVTTYQDTNGKKIERDFYFQGAKSKPLQEVEDFISQGIVRNFQEATAAFAKQLEDQAKKSRSALSLINWLERNAGNLCRCYKCGKKSEEQKSFFICPECKKQDL